MNKVKFGIIGCGQISLVGHIPNLLQIADAVIIAVSDISDYNLAAALKLAPQIKTFKDYREMLKLPEIDVIVVATPNWLHCKQVITALEAGRNVFCKPLGIDQEECAKVKAALDKSGKLLQIGHELRHAKVLETAKAKLDSGIIGDVKLLLYSELRKPLLPGWRQTGRTGGIMLEKNSHFFDLLNWFAESIPEKVIGIGANDVNKESPLIDNCLVAIEYSNGIKAQLTMCLFCEQGDRNGMEIIGSKGMMRISGETLEIFQRNSEKSEKSEIIDCSSSPKENMHMGCRRELEHLIDCLKHGNSLAMTSPPLWKL